MPSFTVIAYLVFSLGYLALCALVGRLVLRLISAHPAPVSLAASPVLGTAALGIQLWLFSLARLPWNPLLLVLPWMLAAVIWRRRLWWELVQAVSWLHRQTASLWREDRIGFGLMALVVVVSLTHLLDLVTQPLTGFDAISMWYYKAQVFYHTRSLELANLPNLQLTWPGTAPTRFPITAGLIRSLDYPPLYSLEIASVFTLAGGVHETLGKGLDFLFVVTSLGTVIAVLGPILGRRLSLAVALLVTAIAPIAAGMDNPIYTGYADYPIGVVMLAALANLRLVQGEHRSSGLALALLLAGVAALMKSEGQPFLLIVSAVIVWELARRRRSGEPAGMAWLQLSPTLLLLFLLVLWQVHVYQLGWRSHHLFNDSPLTLLGAVPIRVLLVVAYSLIRMKQVPDYIPLAIALALVSLAVIRGPASQARTVWLVVTGQCLAFFIVFVLNPGEITGTFDRAVTELAPSVILLLGLLVGQGSASARPPALAAQEDFEEASVLPEVELIPS